jgi:hypothetical protein
VYAVVASVTLAHVGARHALELVAAVRWVGCVAVTSAILGHPPRRAWEREHRRQLRVFAAHRDDDAIRTDRSH